MLIPAGSPVQVFISLFHPLSLFAQSGSMEGGRGKKWQAKMRKQADRDTVRGLEGWGWVGAGLGRGGLERRHPSR